MIHAMSQAKSYRLYFDAFLNSTGQPTLWSCCFFISPLHTFLPHLRNSRTVCKIYAHQKYGEFRLRITRIYLKERYMEPTIGAFFQVSLWFHISDTSWEPFARNICSADAQRKEIHSRNTRTKRLLRRVDRRPKLTQFFDSYPCCLVPTPNYED